MKIWKIRNKKNGRFYLHGSNHNDEKGATYETLQLAQENFEIFFRKLTWPRSSWDPVAKKSIKKPVTTAALKKALDYEIVEYDIVPFKTFTATDFPKNVERLTQVLDPRDIVKLRQKGLFKVADETQE